MNAQERAKKYEGLPAALQACYSSDQAMLLHMGMTQKYQIKDVSSYINVIGDTILGFHKLSELQQLLTSEAGIPAETVEKMLPQLMDFLAPVKELEAGKLPNVATPASTTPDPETPTTTILPTAPAPDVLNPTPAPAPAAPPAPKAPTPATSTPAAEKPAAPADPRAVQPMRTMGSDVTQVQGYQAYRSLFPEADELDDTPTVQSSSQDDLLEHKPRLAATPTYKADGSKS